jgi:hypothetical protein
MAFAFYDERSVFGTGCSIAWHYSLHMAIVKGLKDGALPM